MNNTLSLASASIHTANTTERLEQIVLRQRHDRRMDGGFLATIALLATLAATTVGMLSHTIAKPTTISQTSR